MTNGIEQNKTSKNTKYEFTNRVFAERLVVISLTLFLMNYTKINEIPLSLKWTTALICDFFKIAQR